MRSWEEQRKGGKRSYFLLYIIAGTIVTSIGVAFVQSMLRFGLPDRLWTIPVISFLVTTGLTWYSWKNNEKRFRELIKRELQNANPPKE